MNLKLLFLAVLVLVLAGNVFAPESICPGGSTPRSDVIWCADFEQLTNCSNGNEQQCWKDNFEKFGGTIDDYPQTYTGADAQYGFRVVPNGAIGTAAAGNGFVYGLHKPGGTGPSYSRIFPPQSSSVYNLRYYIRFGGQTGKGYMEYGAPHGPGIVGRDPTNGCFVGGTFEESQSAPSFYVNVLCQPAETWADGLFINQPNPVPRENGKWYLVELQRVADTACTNPNDKFGCNGIFRAWIDGQLIIEYTNVNWSQGSGRLKWDEIWGPRSYYHPKVPSWGFEIDYDNFAVSTKEPSTCPGGKGPCIGAAANENPRGTADAASPYWNYDGIAAFYGRHPAGDCTSPAAYPVGVGEPQGYFYPSSSTPWFQTEGLPIPLETSNYFNGFPDSCPTDGYSPQKSFMVKLTQTNIRGGLFWERTLASIYGYNSVHPQQVIHGQIYIPTGNDFAANPPLSGFVTYQGNQYGRYVAMTVNNGKYAIVRRNDVSSPQTIIATSNAAVQYNSWQEFELMLWNDGTASLMIGKQKVIPKTAHGMPAGWFFQGYNNPNLVLGVIDFQGTATATNPFTVYYDDVSLGSASFWSCDGWGTSCPFNLSGDATPPTITITSPTNLDTYTTTASTINISGTSSDNVGVSSVAWNNITTGANGTATGTTNWSINNIALQAGANTINVYATDAAGNIASDSLTINPAPADTIAPTVAFTSPLNGAVISGTATMTATASDASGISKVEFYIDGILYGIIYSAPYTHPIITTSYSNGNHVLKAKAFDNSPAKNSAETSISVCINNGGTGCTGDTTPPNNVAITSPANGATVSGTTNVAATASDNVGVTLVEFFIDNVIKASVNVSPFSFAWNTLTYVNGLHSIFVKAYDAATNSTTSPTINATVNNSPTDITPPTVSITSPANNATVSSNVTINATAADASGIAKIEFLIDGILKSTDTAAPYSYVWDSTTATNGAHTITAKAYDTATPTQNVTTATINATVNNPTTDIIPPNNVLVTFPANGATISGTINMLATASDNVGVVKVTFFVDNAIYGNILSAPYSHPLITTNFSNGSHTIKATAFDAANNSTTSPTITITINNAAICSSGSACTTTQSCPGTCAADNVTCNDIAGDGCPAAGNTFYVATTGNDSNPGTLALPWKTVKFAANRLTAGQTALIRAGTYNENNITFTYSGTAGNPITLKNYPGESPIIDGGATTSTCPWNNPPATCNPVIDIIGSSTTQPQYAKNYITIDGLIIKRGFGRNIAIGSDYTADNIVIQNNELIDVLNPDVSSNAANIGTGGNGGSISNILIQNNKIHGYQQGTNPNISDNGTGIHLFDAENVQVKNNEVYNMDNGIYYKHGSNQATQVIFENNLVYNMTRNGIHLSRSGAIVRNNVVRNSAQGIDLYAEEGSCSRIASVGNQILHNTIVDSQGGIRVGQEGTNCAPNGAIQTMVRDNLAYNFSDAGLAVWCRYAGDPSCNVLGGADGSQTTFSNNLLFSSQIAASNFVRIKFNTYSIANLPATILGKVGNIDASPTFTNYAGYNFTLTGTIGRNAASDGTDIGAKICLIGINASCSGSGDTINPTITITSPTNLDTYTTTASTINISGTSSDNIGVSSATWTNSTGGAGTATGTTNWSASNIALQTGTNIITVTAKDAANNTGTDILTVAKSSTLDTTPPQVSITFPLNGAAINGTTNIAVTATDNIGVARVEFYLDTTTLIGTSTTSPYSFSWNTLTTTNGSHTITAKAFDAAGNSSTPYTIIVNASNTLVCIDADADGYGTNCALGPDCNDGNPSIHPGAAETCNALDDNCNLLIDEGFDADGDTYTVCGGDCNDSNASINPAAKEICGNGIDEDCSGADAICQATNLCGNGRIDIGENCSTCPADVPLGASQICCSGNITTPTCSSPDQCNDLDTCTIDSCNNPGACNSYCSFTTVNSCTNNPKPNLKEMKAEIPAVIIDAQLFTITIKQSNNNKALSGASATYNSQTKLTDAQGKASFIANKTTNKISIEKTGYKKLSITFTIIIPFIPSAVCGNGICEETETITTCPVDCLTAANTPVSELQITAMPSQTTPTSTQQLISSAETAQQSFKAGDTVQVIVTESGEPVTGATVTYTDQTGKIIAAGKTDAFGTISFTAKENAYQFRAVKEGHKAATTFVGIEANPLAIEAGSIFDNLLSYLQSLPTTNIIIGLIIVSIILFVIFIEKGGKPKQKIEEDFWKI